MSEPVDPREQFGEHGEWDALAVGWALSALDPEDEERFAEHLPGCARCTATVREALYTVADMAYALPDEPPPASLKARIMAAVAAEPRTPGAMSSPPPSTAEPRLPGTAEPGIPAAIEPQSPSAVEPEYPGAVEPRSPGAVEPEYPGAVESESPVEPEHPGAIPAARPPAEPEPEDDWSLDEPPPGSPGEGIDWFAKPPRSAQPPPPGPLAAAPPTIRPGSAADERSAADQRAARDEPAAASRRERLAGYEAPPSGEREIGDERPPGADRSAPAEPSVVEERPGGTSRGGPAPGGETADVVPLAPRRRLGRRLGTGVTAAAVLALIAGLLVWNVRLRDQQSDLRQVVAQRDAAIQQLTANGPAKVAALTANGQPSPDRRATLVVRGDDVEIIIESLGPTTGNETYWLWTLRCDTPQPTDLKPIRGFTVTQSEFSVRDIGSDAGVASAPCFAISSEQGTATPKAPRQVVAVGQAR